jgi:hypothetical protein
MDGPEYAFGFSAIAGVSPLRSGDVVVVDQIERTLSLVDWKSAEPRRLGRNGNGPNEYAAPRALFSWPGDSLLVHDIGNSRYLILAPDGTPARVMTGPTTDGFAYTPLRAVDAAGRPYVERRGARPAGADTQPILRWTPATGVIDTAAYVSRPPLPPVAQSQPRAGQISARVVPFRARDEWDVTADGRVVIVHADPYFVESVGGGGRGGRAVGARQPYVPRPVTEADKQAWREGQANDGRGRTIRKPGDADARTGGATTIDVRIADPEWSTTMPPFLGSVAVNGDGEVWVTRTGVARDTIALVDVFAASGALIRRVTIPGATRVAGFGPKVVFAVRTDADGLQYLRKFRY